MSETVPTKAGSTAVVDGGVAIGESGEGVLVVVALVGLVGALVVAAASALVIARGRPARGDAVEHPASRPPSAAVTATAATAGARASTGSDHSGGRRAHRRREAKGSVPGRSVARVAVAIAALALAGCVAASAASRSPASQSRPRVAHSFGTTTTSTPPPTTSTSSVPPTSAPTTTSAPPAAPRTATPVTAAPQSDIAGQRVVVSATGYGATTATLTAYQRTTAGWRVAFGPWTADVGYNGFAPSGQKREGDGRTPSGTYSFGFAFGVRPDPGVHLAYRPVTGPNIVWDDDPSSPDYNQWVDTDTANPGANPEPMDNSPAYDYGAVIDYNTAPVVPGAG